MTRELALALLYDPDTSEEDREEMISITGELAAAGRAARARRLAECDHPGETF